MSDHPIPGFTSRQRATVLLMVISVIVVFAMLAGLIVTSMRSLEGTPPAVSQPFVSQPPTPNFTPSPVPSPVSEEGIWSQVQAARLFDQIAHQVETLRGLSPRTGVPLSFLDQGEMAALLRQLYTSGDPQAQVAPYTALGLLPAVPISIRLHPVAGVYVPDQEQLYVATGQEGSTDDQALLAHTYVHALQDQHFDLGGTDARANTTDARLAVQALVEGDAMLLTALYRYEDLAAVDWDHLVELIVRAEKPGYGDELERSPAWARLQRFPYAEGRQFAEVLFQADGWGAINRAYTDPPRSTEQVLHPARYLQEQDGPTSVVVPDLSAVLGEDWTMRLQDTLGEFVAGLYLGTLLPEQAARQAADGWDGDTFVLWEHADGSQVSAWRTIWDSTAEAAEFERAFVSWIPQRYFPVRPLDPPRNLVGQWWETGAGAVCVYRVARYVTVVHAPDLNALANVVEVLP